MTIKNKLREFFVPDEKITPEEKELLRKLMERPNEETQSDFFDGITFDPPPPEFFMRGKPEPRPSRGYKALKVACFVSAVFLCSTVLAIFMTPAPVSAEKSPFEILKSNIVNGFSETKRDNEGIIQALDITIVEEDGIEAVGRNVLPELLIPSYIPEGYVFSYLEIVKTEIGAYNADYIYENEKKECLKICEYFLKEDVGNAYNNMIIDGKVAEAGKMYYKRDEALQSNILTVWADEYTRASVFGTLSLKELEAVYNGLK